MNAPSVLANIGSLSDSPKLIGIVVLSVVTVLPILAVIGAVRARRSSEDRRRRWAPLFALAAVLLTYFHPFTQEFFNTLYLEPKLERARALEGQSLELLIADLGQPSMVVPDPWPSPPKYGYVLYGSAPWTPLAMRELVVPTTNDGQRVSILAHYAD